MMEIVDKFVDENGRMLWYSAPPVNIVHKQPVHHSLAYTQYRHQHKETPQDASMTDAAEIQPPPPVLSMAEGVDQLDPSDQQRLVVLLQGTSIYPVTHNRLRKPNVQLTNMLFSLFPNHTHDPPSPPLSVPPLSPSMQWPRLSMHRPLLQRHLCRHSQ
jgi:hypothetical protein